MGEAASHETCCSASPPVHPSALDWATAQADTRLFSASCHSRSPASACPAGCDVSAEIAIVPKLLGACTSQPLETPHLAGDVVDPAAYSLPFVWGPRRDWTRM